MGKLTFVYNFLALWLASSGNQRILNFRVVAVRDIKLRARLLKKISYVVIFSLFRGFKY